MKAKVLTVGHRYEIPCVEMHTKNGPASQILQFIEKKPVRGGAGDLETIANGVTCEDVIEVLIDRLQVMQAQFPSRENAISITKLEEALMWQHKRTADRQARKVEGRAAP